MSARIFAVAPSASIVEVFGTPDTAPLAHGPMCATCWVVRSVAGTCQRCDG